MHFVIMVGIPCVYVIHTFHPLSFLSFRYAIALKFSLITHSELSPSSTRQASDIHLFNVPATYYPCPFLSIFRQFCRFLERMKTVGANPENPENLVVHCARFRIRFVFIGHWDRALRGKMSLVLFA